MYRVSVGKEEITNVRAFERAFKRYLNEDYGSLIHGNIGNDGARVVSVKMERLFQAIYRNNKSHLLTRYSFTWSLLVDKELIDKETGEVYNPEIPP